MQFFKTPKIDFIGKRYVAFTISIILIIIGICAITIKGPNYGIDFSGGILMQFSFDKDIQMDVIRQGLSSQEGLNFELPVGLRINGEVHKDVELLKTNGVAEKIFTKKLAEKPFTWQGNIVSAAVKSIGSIQIGAEVRKKYLEDGAVTIPQAVLSLTCGSL